MKPEVLEELAWVENDICQNCVWFCPWNGRGWGCAHPEINMILRGDCRCDTAYFKQARPWAIDGTEIK
jgi:hypothetical protein